MEHFRGCLGSYSGHLGIFPSKADRIMSRYRPIAPKPALPCVFDGDKSASSAITVDSLCLRHVPDAPASIAPPFSKQKNKRVRKRPSKESDAQEPAKRLATGSLLNVAEKGLSLVFPAEAAQLNIPEDVGFMERAAASAPSSVFPFEKARKAVPTNNNYGFGGCFTEMIRGIAGLPSAAHVHNLLQQQQQQQQQGSFFSVLAKEPSKQQVDLAPLQSNAREERDCAKEELSSDAFWACFSRENLRDCTEKGVSEEQQQSGLDEENSDGEDAGRKRVVTLNLLPVAPTRGDSPTISTCSSSRKSFLNRSNILVYVEQVYGLSSEPVVLVDDSSRAVLWVNQGYVKACKDSSNTSATFIDPLGIPTQLGQFQVQLDGQNECISATLWGFLKKLVVDLGERDASRCTPYQASFPLESEKGAQVPSTCSKGCISQQQYGGRMQDNSQPMAVTVRNDSLIMSRVITPQPVRLVGSVVSLESITEVQNRDTSLGTWDLAKKHLEEDRLPGFITDGANVVRWVNTAYKIMVGQPKCPWLVSTVKAGDETPTITGEVLLSCNVEVPHLATFFSGRANVQWTRNTGERSCMTVPCDVSSVLDSNARRILVWRFDIQASLSLTCGVER